MWKSVEGFWQYFWEIFKDSWVPEDADGFVPKFFKCSERPTGLIQLEKIIYEKSPCWWFNMQLLNITHFLLQLKSTPPVEYTTDLDRANIVL